MPLTPALAHCSSWSPVTPLTPTPPMTLPPTMIGNPPGEAMTPGNVMMAGTTFAGAVQITARVDRDGEAMTRAAGDIEGVLRAEIPAGGLKIVLDTPVKP